MIGGFVEQQQIGLADQRARQQHPAFVATGQAAKLGIGVQLHLGNDRFDPLINVPSVDPFELGLTAFQLV